MTADIDQCGIMQLPDEIIEKFDLHPGDEVHFEIQDSGIIIMTFPKKKEIEIDIEDFELFKLMKLAHKRDITLNQLIEDVLRAEMDKKFSIKQDLKEIT
jgi:antitoxin component of MazEF toxin-antitoxin module